MMQRISNFFAKYRQFIPLMSTALLALAVLTWAAIRLSAIDVTLTVDGRTVTALTAETEVMFKLVVHRLRYQAMRLMQLQRHRWNARVSFTGSL